MTEIQKYWLLGLLEGEGYFSISKQQTPYKNKIYYFKGFRFGIEMVESNEVFERIQGLFGCGHVYSRQRKGHKLQYIFQISKISDLINFYYMFKDLDWGTKKKQQFDIFYKELFEYINLGYGLRNNPARRIQ